MKWRKRDTNKDGIRSYFKPYEEIIDNLMDMYIIETKNNGYKSPDNITACQLSVDSKYLIIILKNSDEHYKIRVVSSQTFKITLHIDLRGVYIKACAIHQNNNGKVFNVPYLKNGKFHIIVFTFNKVLDNINMSEKVGLNHNIRPNDNLDFPFMETTFFSMKGIGDVKYTGKNTNNDKIFVAMFVPQDNEMHMLKYCYRTHKIMA